MENGVKALMMGFAMIVFVIGITVSFRTLTKAKRTADVVFYYSDRENFQELKSFDPSYYQNGIRTVNRDTVISTLFRCMREKFSVEIIDNGTYIFEYDVMTKEEIQEQINNYVLNGKGNTFYESFVEVKTSGEIYVAPDGTALEENVGKKLYIRYTKVS